MEEHVAGDLRSLPFDHRFIFPAAALMLQMPATNLVDGIIKCIVRKLLPAIFDQFQSAS